MPFVTRAGGVQGTNKRKLFPPAWERLRASARERATIRVSVLWGSTGGCPHGGDLMWGTGQACLVAPSFDSLPFSSRPMFSRCRHASSSVITNSTTVTEVSAYHLMRSPSR